MGLWSTVPSASKRFAKWTFLRRTVTLAVVLPAMISTIYWLIRTFSYIGPQEYFAPHERPLIRSLATIPMVAIPARGIYVLMCLTFGHVDLGSLAEEIEKVAVISVNSREMYVHLLKKWRRTNALLLVYCIAAFWTTVILNDLHNSLSLTHGSEDGSVKLAPLSLRIPLWVIIVMDVVFSRIPYVLSQLVLITITASAFVLIDCVVSVNGNLEGLDGEIVEMMTQPSDLPTRNRCSGYLDNPVYGIERSTSVAETLMQVRAAQFHFVDRTNHKLGVFLLISYLVDLVVSAGMLAVVITNEEHTPYSLPAKVVGTAVFVSYAILVFVPMVIASEKALSTASILYQTIMKANDLLKTPQGKALRKVLTKFRTLASAFPINFSAGNLFYIDRNFLVATFTLLFTYAVLVREFLDQQDVRALVETSANTSALLEAVLNTTNVSTPVPLMKHL
ncbi:uncharacterized protein LOC129586850 [Paramacrobiotus metropolitanus]|uniref:uncharacterized protein LOC129586850 n=1 Tax=Paramacrobiotus metropolitanus TaxID=2943436 RepID=UPI002445E123|nr:uncharacterized protein LOC129586850 [Paramacrobiotus metropolitanus]